MIILLFLTFLSTEEYVSTRLKGFHILWSGLAEDTLTDFYYYPSFLAENRSKYLFISSDQPNGKLDLGFIGSTGIWGIFQNYRVNNISEEKRQVSISKGIKLFRKIMAGIGYGFSKNYWTTYHFTDFGNWEKKGSNISVHLGRIEISYLKFLNQIKFTREEEEQIINEEKKDSLRWIRKYGEIQAIRYSLADVMLFMFHIKSAKSRLRIYYGYEKGNGEGYIQKRTLDFQTGDEDTIIIPIKEREEKIFLDMGLYSNVIKNRKGRGYAVIKLKNSYGTKHDYDYINEYSYRENLWSFISHLGFGIEYYITPSLTFRWALHSTASIEVIMGKREYIDSIPELPGPPELGIYMLSDGFPQQSIGLSFHPFQNLQLDFASEGNLNEIKKWMVQLKYKL